MTGRAKLNAEETRLIVSQFQGGRSMSTLAWVYGVEVDVIESVIRRVMNEGAPVPEITQGRKS